MSQTGPFQNQAGMRNQTGMTWFVPADLPIAAFRGVRTRRVVAFCLDFVLVSILVAILWTALFIATFGLSALILPPLFPFVAFFYNGFTVAGPRMGTPGMRAMDLEIRAIDGAPVSFIAAAIHAVLLYVSWMVPPVFLVSLLASDKRCLHDMLAGVVVIRRPY